MRYSIILFYIGFVFLFIGVLSFSGPVVQSVFSDSFTCLTFGSSSPESAIEFNQSQSVTGSYNVTIDTCYVGDYYIVTAVDEDGNFTGNDFAKNVPNEVKIGSYEYFSDDAQSLVIYGEEDPYEVDRAPDNAGLISESINPINDSTEGAVLVSKEDKATITGLSDDDTVLVYSGVLGREYLVVEKEVKDIPGTN